MRPKAASRLARLLIRLYPGRWRVRYDAEILEVLEMRPTTWADAWDLARHVFYANLHPDLAFTGEESAVERLVELMRALRSSEIGTFYAFVAAVIAWLQFGGLVDGGPYMPLTDSAGSWPFFGTSPANGVSAALAVQSAAVDLAFLAMLAGGVPLAVAAWRRAPALRRYFLIPPLAFVGAVLPAPISALLRGHVATINLTFTTPLTVAYCIWFVVLAAASTWALGRVIAGSDLADGLLRFAFVPSVLVTIALLLLLGSTFAWGILAHQEYPHLFDHSAITLGHVTLTSWLFDVLVMTSATIVALFATIRGASTWPATASR